MGFMCYFTNFSLLFVRLAILPYYTTKCLNGVIQENYLSILLMHQREFSHLAVITSPYTSRSIELFQALPIASAN